MRTTGLNLFILSENALVAHGLRHHLNSRFNGALNIQCFFDVKGLLRQVSGSTDAVVLDYFVEGQKGSDLMKSVKAIAPRVKGIYHSTEEEVVQSLQSLLRDESMVPVPAYSFKLDEQYGHYYVRI